MVVDKMFASKKKREPLTRAINRNEEVRRQGSDDYQDLRKGARKLPKIRLLKKDNFLEKKGSRS